MTNIKHITFNQTSGVLVKGTNRVTIDAEERHMSRAFWLTSQLESSKWGTVQSYDGAGISAGPLHNTAILPKSAKQGSLWRLLRYLEIDQLAGGAVGVRQLWSALRIANLYVSRRGELRRYDSGTLATVKEILNTFAPPNGRVPKQGPHWEQARAWALRFHECFAEPRTYHAQREFAIEYMIKGRDTQEELAYPTHLDYESAAVGTKPNQIPMEIDLAMCVYHSHSINSPFYAGMALTRAMSVVRPQDHERFARRLLWELGTVEYGRWKDDVRGHNRYDSTRLRAWRSGLWPDEFFEGRKPLMPENLKKRPPT